MLQIRDAGFVVVFFSPKANNPSNKWIKQILACHENAKCSIKLLDCMSGVLRYDLSLCQFFFHAVENVTQIAIENGEKSPDASDAHEF